VPLALVTGATGFLGGRLAKVLADRGVEIRLLARGGDVDAACRGVTHVYHCAGCSTDWAPWGTYYESNVELVRRMLGAAAGVERFLHVSTTDVYGYPIAPCDELHAAVDSGLPYNRSKMMGEGLVWEASRAGLPVTIVRPATIYGPRGKAFVTDIAALIRQGAMAVIDGGRSPGGFCYVDNAVDAMIAAAHSSATVGRVYNIADGTGVTWRTYVDALARGLGKRRPWIDIPAAAALPLARVLEALPGKPLLTRHAVYLLSRNQEYPTARARADFGFAPEISFEEGMARTIEWLKR
jgi:nucleoside-diphosphate-sugar epimerase